MVKIALLIAKKKAPSAASKRKTKTKNKPRKTNNYSHKDSSAKIRSLRMSKMGV
jgi:hypothetical protein